MEKIVTTRWYTQGTNAVPLFIITSAYSAFRTKSVLGFGYSKFLFHFKKEYGEMNYVNSDFGRIWAHIQEKQKRNPRYLQGVKKKYERIFESQKKQLISVFKKGLAQCSDEELLRVFKKCMSLQTDSVGIAHVIEAVGQMLEKHFRVALHAAIPDKRAYTDTFSFLTTPKQLSFVAREEKELLAIGKLPKTRQHKALQRHAKKYSWIQNTYAGSVQLSLDFLKKKMKELMDEEKKGKKKVNTREHRVVPVEKRIRDMAQVIRFTTAWQDARKENILLAIEYLDTVTKEIARRTRIPVKSLYYLAYEPYSATSI